VLQSAAGFIAIPLFASLVARPNLPRVVGWTEFNYSIHVLVLRNASRYLYIHLLFMELFIYSYNLNLYIYILSICDFNAQID
jgi:hypothetical protein